MRKYNIIILKLLDYEIPNVPGGDCIEVSLCFRCISKLRARYQLMDGFGWLCGTRLMGC